MRVLFIHQNFPGQFQLLAPALAASETVVAIGAGDRDPNHIAHLQYCPYPKSTSGVRRSDEPTDLTSEVRRGRACLRCLEDLKARGFRPDVVIAHPAWGEALFLRDVYPRARLISYLEYFYRSTNSDVDFDPEFPSPSYGLQYVRFRNIPSLMAFAEADCSVTPTMWQGLTFPDAIRRQLTTLHDGIDTDRVVPDPGATFALPDGRPLTAADEVISYVARSLEPYRGFHVFMRALPDVMRRRPNATVVIVGGDDVSYGTSAGPHTTWRQRMLDEVGQDLDPARISFVGRLPYDRYLSLLQVSSVHVYLTYPFVLSWSLLEAMSAGCAVVASDTGPVTEVVTDGENGRLFPFFDCAQLAARVEELADDLGQRRRLGRAARDTIVTRYDFRSRILPRYRSILHELAGRDP